MLNRLTRIAALAMAASCATASFGPTAFGQPQGSTQLPMPSTLKLYLLAPVWHDSASCTVTANVQQTAAWGEPKLQPPWTNTNFRRSRSNPVFCVKLH